MPFVSVTSDNSLLIYGGIDDWYLPVRGGFKIDIKTNKHHVIGPNDLSIKGQSNGIVMKNGVTIGLATGLYSEKYKEYNDELCLVAFQPDDGRMSVLKTLKKD